ncbi:MAG: bifunctional metallophosphatase/5'-nucleotidase, partial [Deltaproteobacteria bacterium]|nr:bifunctional metallophosphatase/5'-nucleotidase [Deltaproteobacteria bacterium]
DLHGHLEHFASQARLVEKIRRENGQKGIVTFVLFAGDLFTGTPISSVWRGDVEVEAVNRLGLDLMVVGNHDFDFSLPRLLALHKKMKFPLISANIFYSGSGQLLFSPLHELAQEQTRLAVLGLTAPRTPVQTHPDNVKGLLFADPVETTKQYLADLRRADFQIALTHMEEKDDRELLKQFKTVDLILAGHTHPDPKEKPYCRKVRSRHLCRTPAYGTHMGRIDLTPSGEDWKVAATELIPLDAGLPEDPKIKSWLARYEREVDRRYGQIIAYAKDDLPHHREGPTPLGRLIAGVMKEYSGADVALINSGGIRYSLKKGPIRMKDVITILPFNNFPQVLELTGKELKAVLKFSEKKKNSGGYLQTAGLDGKKFGPEAKIKVCTADFLTAGGDGYSHFKDKKIAQSYSKTIGEIFAEYLKNQHTIAVAE